MPSQDQSGKRQNTENYNAAVKKMREIEMIAHVLCLWAVKEYSSYNWSQRTITLSIVYQLILLEKKFKFLLMCNLRVV